MKSVCRQQRECSATNWPADTRYHFLSISADVLGHFARPCTVSGAALGFRKMAFRGDWMALRNLLLGAVFAFAAPALAATTAPHGDAAPTNKSFTGATANL